MLVKGNLLQRIIDDQLNKMVEQTIIDSIHCRKHSSIMRKEPPEQNSSCTIRYRYINHTGVLLYGDEKWILIGTDREGETDRHR